MSDMFPYESPTGTGTTVLGEYQRQARQRPLWWLLPVAIAAFVIFGSSTTETSRTRRA